MIFFEFFRVGEGIRTPHSLHIYYYLQQFFFNKSGLKVHYKFIRFIVNYDTATNSFLSVAQITYGDMFENLGLMSLIIFFQSLADLMPR